eukprot:gene34554-42620_t
MNPSTVDLKSLSFKGFKRHVFDTLGCSAIERQTFDSFIQKRSLICRMIRAMRVEFIPGNTVSTKTIKTYGKKNSPHIIAFDCGMKFNILRCFVLEQKACVTVVPFDYPLESSPVNILYRGSFVSNGPGDPMTCVEAIVASLRWAVEQMPRILGFYLSHQPLTLTCGAKTYYDILISRNRGCLRSHSSGGNKNSGQTTTSSGSGSNNGASRRRNAASPTANYRSIGQGGATGAGGGDEPPRRQSHQRSVDDLVASDSSEEEEDEESDSSANESDDNDSLSHARQLSVLGALSTLNRAVNAAVEAQDLPAVGGASRWQLDPSRDSDDESSLSSSSSDNGAHASKRRRVSEEDSGALSAADTSSSDDGSVDHFRGEGTDSDDEQEV